MSEHTIPAPACHACWQYNHDACSGNDCGCCGEGVEPTTFVDFDGRLCDVPGSHEHDGPDEPTCGAVPCVCFMPTCTPMPIGCYLCTRDAGGDVFAPSGHPMRLPVASGVSRGPDPTVWHRLDCGHTII